MLPKAPPDIQAMAKEIFGTQYEAEEWVARFSHTVGCSSFDRYSYSDKALESLIYKVHELLSLDSTCDIPSLRRKFLSEAEIREIEEQIEF